MKKKAIVLSIFLMLVISTVAVNGLSINKNNIIKTEKKIRYTNFEDSIIDAELPIWNIGDTWVYDGSIEGKQGTVAEFDIDFNDMTLEVSAVNPTNYTVDISVEEGDVTGRVSGELGIKVTGNLKDTFISGFFYVNKTDLAIDSFDVNIEGTVDAFIDVDFSAQLKTIFFDGITFDRMMYNTLDFPINIADTWDRLETYVITEASVNLLPDPISLYFDILETSFSCNLWDMVDVSGTDYDALKIQRNDENNHIWYSPRAGNIIKVDFSNMDLNFGYYLDSLTMNLKSTNYYVPTVPPETPSVPSGEAIVDVGTAVTYATSTTDQDGDKIRYIFDFSDGTTVTSDFYESGVEASVSKIWEEKGNFEVKVKARDKWGGESDYSDVFSVEVLNDPPAKPETPSGETNGQIKKKSYTYTTSSTDPNGHKIRFEFDWGDGSKAYSSYVNSGESGSATNTWYSQGSYEIKVRAEDEYGEQSEWSDPLLVSMPKTKSIMLQNFPIFSKILQKFSLFLEKMEIL